MSTWEPPGATKRRNILRGARTIAVVGASANPARASNFVLTYLLSSSADYEVWPVTPNETEILGAQCYPSLADLPGKPDIVDVFRRADQLPQVAREAVEAGAGTFWMQLGLHSDEAVEIASSAGPRRRLQPLREDRARALPRRPAPRGLRHRRHLVATHPWLKQLTLAGRADVRERRARGTARDRLLHATARPSTPRSTSRHALTGDADAADWWGTLIGPGKAVDTDRFHVICANILGGCKGTTGPASTNPATGERYGLDFPLFTIRDMVAVHRRLLRELGVTKLYAAVGGSLGGMQILQWALDHPDEIERAVLVCATARLTAGNIAFSKVARHAILTHDAMDVARMMAHITYVSEESLRRKFSRNRRGEAMTLGSDFEVEHYLDYQAKIFLERFDPHSYLYLSRVMDYYDPFAEAPAAPAHALHARVLRQRLALRDRALGVHRRAAARASART